MNDLAFGLGVGFLTCYTLLLVTVYNFEKAGTPQEQKWSQFQKDVRGIMIWSPLILGIATFLALVPISFVVYLSCWPYILQYLGMVVGIEVTGVIFWVLARREVNKARTNCES